MRYPRTFIDDLHRQADIVRVVSDYLQLKKRGNRWVACCPFHHEKTPSFGVSPSKGAFYCFGCQKGGSVFNFVMEIEGISFPEAIKVVAQKVGVTLPQMEDDAKFEARRDEADDVIKLNSWALEFWEARLSDDSPEAHAARQYVDSRGISESTRQAFRLGFAPDSWDALTSFLRSKGASATQIEQSGLVVKKDSGGVYDRFRGRLIFPVMDAQGRPIAFGGRTMAVDGEPKYMNSPETAAYTKGRNLFGLNLTKDHIRRQKFAVLVEGYLDLLIPYQYGVCNVVASLGTALTPEQAKLLGRFARKVVVNYDGDRAGVQAAKRAIETLLPEDFEIKVLVLPDGADPDEFIRKYGVEAYQENRGKALPHIQFVLDQVLRDRNLHRPVDKANAVEEALPYVRAVRNSIQKREYFDLVLTTLRVDEESLRRELWQTVKGTASIDSPSVRQKIVRAVGGQPTIAEQRLLELLVHDESVRRTILPRLETTDYEDLPTAGIFAALISIGADRANVDFSTLAGETEDDPETADLVAMILMADLHQSESGKAAELHDEAESCLRALRLMAVDRRLSALSAEIGFAERAGDEGRRNELSKEHLKWTRSRSALFSRTEAALLVLS